MTTYTDYNYDNNGNATSDANKNITSIKYNYSNKPYEIDFTGGRTIYFRYNAIGTLLNKKILDPGHLTVTIDYLGGLEYDNNALASAADEEGKVRPINLVNTTTLDTTVAFEYDYFVRDHQGNVRSVVTEEIDSNWSAIASGGTSMSRVIHNSNPGNIFDPASFSVGNRTYVATSELSNAGQERVVFSNVDSTRDNKPLSVSPSDVKASRLNAAEHKTIGPSMVLRVMAGDSISINTEAYYQHDSENDHVYTTTNQLINNLLTALGGAGAYGTLNESGLDISEFHGPLLNDKLVDIMNLEEMHGVNNHKPQAFLNYIMLDDNMQPVNNGTGFVQTLVSDNWTSLAVGKFPIKTNGYIFIFPSNVSPMNVHFDNLYVTHYKGSLESENHYYPYGLTITTNAITTAPDNNILYESKRLHHSEFSDGTGLDWYQYGARFYDPQIGRWHVSDPLTEKQSGLSPYHYCFGNPVIFTDPSGLFPQKPLPNPLPWQFCVLDPIADGSFFYQNGGGPLDKNNPLSGGYFYSLENFGHNNGYNGGYGNGNWTDGYGNNNNANQQNGLTITELTDYAINHASGQITTLNNRGDGTWGINYPTLQDYKDILNITTSGGITGNNANGYVLPTTTATLYLGSANDQGVINIYRFVETDLSTIGTFTTGSGFHGYTLEPPGPSTTLRNQDRRIPAGTYHLAPHVNTRIHCEWQLYNDDVPKDRYVLFHIGIYPDDTQGCILFGPGYTTDQLLPKSGPVIDAVNDYIDSYNGNVIVNIYDIPSPGGPAHPE